MSASFTVAARLGTVPIYAISGLLGAFLLKPFPGIPQIAFSILLFALYVGCFRTLFRGKSLVDVGTFFLFVVLIYQIFPLLSLEITDYNLGVFADNRLNTIALSTSFLSDVWSIQTLILTGFGASYLAFKSERPKQAPVISPAQRSLFGTVLAVSFLIVVGANIYLAGDDYLDQYLSVQSLPLFVVQGLNIVNQMFFAAMFGFLVLSMRGNVRRALAVTFGACVILLFTTGARTPVAIVIFAAVVVYDHYRARLNPALLLSIAVTLLLIFLLAGALRGSGYTDDLLGQNEFMAIYVTTLDVFQIAITGAARDLGNELWIADLLRPIPGQLLPFEKFDAALWYITSFYPLQAQAGEGYGFSMASEAMLGGGNFSALARSGLLGMAVALINGKLEASRSIYAKVGAVWLFCFIYLSYRDTTFTLVPRLMFQFGPGLLVIFLIDRMFILKPDADASPGLWGER